MPGLFDRLGKVAQQTAAAAEQAAAEGKIRLDINSLKGRLDDRAKALGHLVYRRQQGEDIAEEELAKLLEEMTQIETQRKAKEAELESLRHRGTAPAPTPAPTAQPVAAAETTAPASATCSCGAANPPGAKFCSSCGKPLASGS